MNTNTVPLTAEMIRAAEEMYRRVTEWRPRSGTKMYMDLLDDYGIREYYYWEPRGVYHVNGRRFWRSYKRRIE